MSFDSRRCRRLPTLLAGLAVVATGGAALAQSYEMKIGFVTINDSQHISSKWLKERVEKATQGRIKVRIFPAAQLGKIPRQIEGIQLGTQEVFVSPPAFFQGINAAFQAPDAPGLFESQWHQHMAINHATVRDRFARLGESAGFVALYMWSAGQSAVASRDPVRTLDDLKGKKLRVLASKMEVELMKEFGVTGVPIPYSEVLPAIQRRVVDGARSAVIVMGPSKFYTVAKFLTVTAGSYIPSGAWASKAFLNKLPVELRDTLFALGRGLEDETTALAIKLTRDWEKKWSENGGTVIPLPAADRAEFFRRAQPLGDRFLGGDPKVKKMYALLKAAAEETRAAAAEKAAMAE